jgi:amino-acid N-acetyltransferase
MVADRIAWARAQGLGTLYMLTTDGEGYFARHGFARMPREEAPPEIAASYQWSSACPASSVAMRLSEG